MSGKRHRRVVLHHRRRRARGGAFHLLPKSNYQMFMERFNPFHTPTMLDHFTRNLAPHLAPAASALAPLAMNALRRRFSGDPGSVVVSPAPRVAVSPETPIALDATTVAGPMPKVKRPKSFLRRLAKRFL